VHIYSVRVTYLCLWEEEQPGATQWTFLGFRVLWKFKYRYSSVVRLPVQGLPIKQLVIQSRRDCLELPATVYTPVALRVRCRQGQGWHTNAPQLLGQYVRTTKHSVTRVQCAYQHDGVLRPRNSDIEAHNRTSNRMYSSNTGLQAALTGSNWELPATRSQYAAVY